MSIMDFYDDIDVDFGDKLELLEVGELLEMREGTTSKKKSPGRKKNKKNNKIILPEDEVDDTEYTVYDPPQEKDYGIDMVEIISQEVSEMFGNYLSNEPLEQKYKNENVVVMKSEPKTKSSSKCEKVTPDSKILKKADLQKEMNAMVAGADVQTKIGIASDCKVAFSPAGKKKEKNALLKGLEKQKNIEINSNASESSSANRKNQSNDQAEARTDNTAEAINEQNEKSPLQHQESIRYFADIFERVRLWLESSSCSDASCEEFYSNDSNYTTDGSTSYFTASASDNETPVRKYRATSKRSTAKKSPVVSEEKIGFKTNTTNVTTKLNNRSAIVNLTKKKSPIRKIEQYTPGSYNNDFKLKLTDFPAIS